MAETVPLYARVIRGSWPEIAEPLRCVHEAHSIVRACGNVRIEHGCHPLARILTRLLRLPRPNRAARARLTVTVHGNEEVWQRTFDGRRLDTRQYESPESCLAERFGVLEFRYRLDACRGSLLYVQKDAALRLGSWRRGPRS
jgi:hypothetical protein